MEAISPPARRRDAETLIEVGCVYIKHLDDVDLDVLEALVARSYAALTEGTFTNRAREGGGS